MKKILAWTTTFVLFAAAFSFAGELKVPAVSEVTPQPGTEDVNVPQVSITFNMRMDKKSVEKSFYIFPEVKGSFLWKENTLIFQPEKELFPSTTYFVSLNSRIRNEQGVPLLLTYFTTPSRGLCVGPDGKLRIISMDAQDVQLPAEGNNPVWTCDNKSILYDQDGVICRIDITGNDSVHLTEKEEGLRASHPMPCPYSETAAFLITDEADIDNVFTVDLKTKIVKQVTSFFDPEKITYLRWSPDGLYLAFLRAGQIWVINQDGKDLRKLTTNELPCKGNFAWSPGGTKIAFSGEENVWVGDIYSSELRKVSFDDPHTGLLDWSVQNKIVYESEGLIVMDGENGTRIAFRSTRDGNSEIYIMDADGSNDIKVSTAGKNPQWIGRGNNFSYVVPLYDNDNKSQLWMMSSDTVHKEKIGFVNSQKSAVSWSKETSFSKLSFP